MPVGLICHYADANEEERRRRRRGGREVERGRNGGKVVDWEGAMKGGGTIYDSKSESEF